MRFLGDLAPGDVHRWKRWPRGLAADRRAGLAVPRPAAWGRWTPRWWRPRERLGVQDLATFDRRHLSVVSRPPTPPPSTCSPDLSSLRARDADPLRGAHRQPGRCPAPPRPRRCAPPRSSTPRTPAGRASSSATSGSPGRCAPTSRATRPSGPPNWAGVWQAGETVALLTDAGVPTISDPGLSAVRAALRGGGHRHRGARAQRGDPGAAVSGLPADRFAFEGFLPRRGGALGGAAATRWRASRGPWSSSALPGASPPTCAALAGAFGGGAGVRRLPRADQAPRGGLAGDSGRGRPALGGEPGAGRGDPGGRRGAGGRARPGRGRGPGRGDGGRGRLGVGGVPGRGRGTGDPPPRPLRSGHRPPPGGRGLSPAQRLRPMRSIT